MSSGEPLLIFSINSGRAGSAYLQRLLLAAEGVVGAHEQPPTMTGDYLFVVEAEPRQQSLATRRIKADAVRTALAESPDATAYADTSNMFVKTFADVIVDGFDPARLRVLHLRRDVQAVAKSFRELGCFTEQNTVSRPWMFDPLAPQALAAGYYRVDSDDPTEMIVGYLVETELQGQRFRAEHPDVLLGDVWLDELQTLDQVNDLFTQLGLRATPELTDAVGARLNAKAQPKADAATPLEDGFADNVTAVLERFRTAGAPIDALTTN